MTASLNSLLQHLVERGGSDLHLRAGSPPLFRVHGDIVRVGSTPLSRSETSAIITELLDPRQVTRLQTEKELDISYRAPNLGRFRVNIYRERGWISAALRLVPEQVKSIDQLGLPPILKQLASLPRGLVLLTGPTGCGKSTTLAAIVDHINEQRSVHVMTIEDPIEFCHQSRRASISQREVGSDTHGFPEALRHVVRQSPDIILVGEMRDPETIQTTITAAELGHLVLTTLHTCDAAQAVDRMVDCFEHERQAQVRTQLSLTLQAVIYQTLVKRCDKEGRVAAFEILIFTPAARNLVREGKTEQLHGLIETGGEYGMQMLDAQLLDLCKQGIITYDAAMAKSLTPRDFQARATAVIGARPESSSDGTAHRSGS